MGKEKVLGKERGFISDIFGRFKILSDATE